MKKLNWFPLVLCLSLLFVTACSNDSESKKGSEHKDGDRLSIITTNSILYDIVLNVGGNLVNVRSLAPIGSDPHQYDPLPKDLEDITNADLVFYNGLNLETGNSWFEDVLNTTGKDKEDSPVFNLSNGVKALYLKSSEHHGEEDPHAWLDVNNGIIYTENAKDALVKIDPKNKDSYEKNAATYIKSLEELHQSILGEVELLPKEDRILVSSEGAFKYFSKAYGFDAYYIWEINSHSEGTPEQLKAIIDIIHEKKVKALFLESSVDPRSMETVSKDTSVTIAGKIFTDSLGVKGKDGDTYIKMIQWNVDVICDGLKQK
ncbi:metal ABC transporter substrate-binding protein [Psychrobacillus glaciei]|uniref:Metal ABC transporter substrate-binding protein n=1 Tax=Psychrobacillus glaciei TaxID=2283160 RepID=A0A5J6SR61_9BACI|nr:zinc ABC transporter substrate-binding protein [Psychrobacillus glaciei]QFG00462.1 metal ABC transporter substrate-binding protein [Psychrobacillus glaciei]